MDRLWSPWRLDYITGPKDKSACVFCRHAEEARANPDNPDSLVLATYDHAYVVLNRYPYNNGHLMVVPYRHTSTLTELSIDELHELMDRFRHVAHEYLEIQSAHLAAIAKGKGGFKKQIEVARRRKEDAKCAILEHQERHGCRS